MKRGRSAMFIRLLQRVKKDQRGITGLETAIILIAFIMVASVLSYVVLTAGLFSAQKVKGAVHTGLEEVTSTMEPKGDVILKMEEGFGTELYFTVGCPWASTPIDFTDTTDGNNVVVISYADDYHQYPTIDWTLTTLNSTDGDNLLDPDELFMITVDLAAVNTGAATDDEKLGRNHKFSIQVKPPRGAILSIERRVPARVSQLVNLH